MRHEARVAWKSPIGLPHEQVGSLLSSHSHVVGGVMAVSSDGGKEVEQASC